MGVVPESVGDWIQSRTDSNSSTDSLLLCFVQPMTLELLGIDCRFAAMEAEKARLERESAELRGSPFLSPAALECFCFCYLFKRLFACRAVEGVATRGEERFGIGCCFQGAAGHRRARERGG